MPLEQNEIGHAHHLSRSTPAKCLCTQYRQQQAANEHREKKKSKNYKEKHLKFAQVFRFLFSLSQYYSLRFVRYVVCWLRRCAAVYVCKFPRLSSVSMLSISHISLVTRTINGCFVTFIALIFIRITHMAEYNSFHFFLLLIITIIYYSSLAHLLLGCHVPRMNRAVATTSSIQRRRLQFIKFILIRAHSHRSESISTNCQYMIGKLQYTAAQSVLLETRLYHTCHQPIVRVQSCSTYGIVDADDDYADDRSMEMWRGLNRAFGKFQIIIVKKMSIVSLLSLNRPLPCFTTRWRVAEPMYDAQMDASKCTSIEFLNRSQSELKEREREKRMNKCPIIENVKMTIF